MSLWKSFDLSGIRPESDSIFRPSLVSRFFCHTKMEPPSIFLSTVILINRYCTVKLYLEGIKPNFIKRPPLICRFHCRTKVESPSSISFTLIVMELIYWFHIWMIVWDVKGDSIKYPSLSQELIRWKVKPPSAWLLAMISVNRLAHYLFFDSLIL